MSVIVNCIHWTHSGPYKIYGQWFSKKKKFKLKIIQNTSVCAQYICNGERICFIHSYIVLVFANLLLPLPLPLLLSTNNFVSLVSSLVSSLLSVSHNLICTCLRLWSKFVEKYLYIYIYMQMNVHLYSCVCGNISWFVYAYLLYSITFLRNLICIFIFFLDIFFLCVGAVVVTKERIRRKVIGCFFGLEGWRSDMSNLTLRS